MVQEGVLLIVSGPSGAGKGTVVERLAREEKYALSVSVTTREPRHYEVEGMHYFFKDKDTFRKMAGQGELLEWAEFCGNYYGTPLTYVKEKLAEGKNVILEIEVQGALKVKAAYPEAVMLFVLPPSLEELQIRLAGRGTEDAETIKKRLRRAQEEIALAPLYDYVIINREIETARMDIEAIVRAELLKTGRNQERINIFKGVDV